MADQPFDYRIQVQNPFEAATQGLRLGANIAQIRQNQQAQAQAMQQKQAELERQRTMQQEVNGFLSNPTADGVLRLSAMMPAEQAKSVREGWAALGEDKASKSLSQVTQIASALLSDTPKVGIDMLNEAAAGARNAGNEQLAVQYETYAKTAEQNPRFAALTALVPTTGTEAGRKALESLIGVQKAPAEILGLEAQAEETKATAARIAEETRIKSEQAKVEADRLAEELKLSKAQRAKVKAETKLLGIEAEKTAMQLEALKASGGIDPAQKLDSEYKLRKEYNDQTKTFREVKSAYGRINASQDSAVGDLSLIFGYMKMLDPGSVVREGEFATAQNAAGVPERVLNAYNRALKGERLSPAQRASFKNQATDLYGAAKKEEQNVRSGLERISRGYGLNSKNIFYTGGEKTVEVDY